MVGEVEGPDYMDERILNNLALENTSIAYKKKEAPLSAGPQVQVG